MTSQHPPALFRPAPNTPSNLILEESGRYQSKGYGFFVASFIFGSVLLSIPSAQTSIYPWLRSLAEDEWLMFFIVHTTLVPFALMIGYLINWAIYRVEHPFFERYKITNEPWPW